MSILKLDMTGILLQKANIFDEMIPNNLKTKKNSPGCFLSPYGFRRHPLDDDFTSVGTYDDKHFTRQSSAVEIARDKARKLTG